MGAITLTQQKSGRPLIMQYVNKCMSENCPIYEECPHSGKVVMCRLHKEYIQALMQNIQNLVDMGRIDDTQLPVVVQMLIPLYNHLFKFQLVEMGNEQPVLHGKVVYIHPVYKEIRSTLKAIYEAWRGFGLVKVEAPVINMTSITNNATDAYYDALTAGTTAVESGQKPLRNRGEDNNELA